MKKVAGSLRLNLAQFRELEASPPSVRTWIRPQGAARAWLLTRRAAEAAAERSVPDGAGRGVHLGGTSGGLDDVPVEDIKRFEQEFLDSLESEHPGILAGIRDSGDLSDDAVTSLESALDNFKLSYTTTAGHLLVKEEQVEPLAEDEIEHEQILRKVRA